MNHLYPGAKAKAILQAARETPGIVTEIDEMKAIIQTAFQARVPYLTNTELIQEALKLNDKLFKPKNIVGILEKLAIAKTLIIMHAEMDRRIAKANGKHLGIPKMEGVKWKKNDPLAGIVEAIPPFQMIDWWGGFLAKKSRVHSKKRAHSKKSVRRTHRPSVIGRHGQVRKPKVFPHPPPRTIEVIKEQIGKPKKFGPDKKNWWKKIGLPLGNLPSYLFVLKLAANWINAIQAGIEDSAARLIPYFVAGGIASMAVNIRDNIWTIVRPGSLYREFVYPEIPEPTVNKYTAAWIAELKRVGQWPTDRKAVHIAESRGLKIAKKIIDKLGEKYSGGGARYLISLKRKFRGNQQDIYAHVYKELKKARI